MNQRAINHIAVLNRGEAASRFLRGLADYNLLRGTAIAHSVVFTDPDAKAPFVRRAAHAIALGPAMQADASGRLRSAYLDVPRIIELLQRNGCDAVWPGWGFLSEDAAFVQTLQDVGIAFLGPSAQAMQRLGDKYAAKQLAEQAAVPLAPWRLAGEASDAELLVLAEQVGYPLMVKASAGGGGRGIRKVTQAADLVAAVQVVRSEVARIFGAGTVLLERCIEGGRHVEVQVVAGADGIAVGLGVRDCSVQRRHQKIIEEAPCPVLPAAVEAQLLHSSAQLAQLAGYRGVCTAEFLWQPRSQTASFLEVNARLQVEHTITELVTGCDLVHAQIDIARGLPWHRPAYPPLGHAIEVRLCAEDPERDCAPSPGFVRVLQLPAGPGVRVDSGVQAGMAIAPEFDSMVAKVMAWGPDRPTALARLRRALSELDLVIEDGAHNKGLLLDLLAHPAVVDCSADTQWLDGALASGELTRSADPTLALLAAGIVAHQTHMAGVVEQFFANAQAGMPKLPLPARGHTLHLRTAGKTWRLHVCQTGADRYSVQLPTQTCDVRWQAEDEGVAVLGVGGQRHRVLLAHGRTGMRMEIDGRAFAVAQAGGNVLTSPAPALVVRVEVQDGDVVVVGQRLAVLEAMKLEMPLLSDREGTIASVVCRAHQQVAAGTPLFEFAGEPDTDTTDVAVAAPPQPIQLQPLMLLAEGGKVRPQRLDDLDAVSAAAVLADLVHISHCALLGYDLPTEAIAILRGLTHIDLDFATLRHPQRWLPLLDVVDDFAAVQACLAREPMDDAAAAGHTAEFAFFDLCRRLHLGDARCDPALKVRIERALARFGVAQLSADPAARQALWRMTAAHADGELRYRCASTLLRAIIGMQAAGVALPDCLSETLVEWLRFAPVAHPAVADNAHHALLALELAPKWQALRAARAQSGEMAAVVPELLQGHPQAEALLADMVLPVGVDRETALRLELWRYKNFNLAQLPAPAPLVALHLRAKDNADDERIVVVAEVSDAPDSLVAPTDPRLVPFELAWLEATRLLRAEQSQRDPKKRLHNNRVVLFVRKVLRLRPAEIAKLGRRYLPQGRGLGLEKVVIHTHLFDAKSAQARPLALSLQTQGRHRFEVREEPLTQDLVRTLDPLGQRRVAARRLGVHCPYDIVRLLQSHGGHTAAAPHPDMQQGRFSEYDLDADGLRLVPVQRAEADNSAGVVVGLIRHHTRKHPEGIERVLLLSDPLRAMGALGEAECRRILAAFDLAESLGAPIEWIPVSSGARIAMDSGTENLDWTARVLRRIVEFTRTGGIVHIIVAGTCVGAQSYWNAMATMLTHHRGVLIMTPEAAMVLTGKRALEVSGSVAAEDERGIGGFDRIMGPNGEAQYLAADLGQAYATLFEHYWLTWCRRGEQGPRAFASTDPVDRSVLGEPYRGEGNGFATVGELFDEAHNPGRKKPFAIRAVMATVVDKDGGCLERWAWWREAETAVVLDAHLGGMPVCVIGFESRPLARRGQIPNDGPDTFSGGTLFPQSSKKVARALRACSGNRPAVVLANLSGFDGSPESMRRCQLEYGAEIGRAVVEFVGPIIFLVIGRYHGGAYVVFSKALNPNLQAIALHGSFASVIGGAPAAAVVFPRLVRQRVDADPRTQAARAALEAAPATKRPRLREKLERAIAEVTLDKQAEVAREFDAIHSVARAVAVGSLDAVIAADRIRPELIERLLQVKHGSGRPRWAVQVPPSVVLPTG
ncbi:MAG: hypothetical protein EXR77_02395 [Myxococcales bacterium]|nr:hypothetical protein [Myxococcales bacterium]